MFDTNVGKMEKRICGGFIGVDWQKDILDKFFV